jgi:hypothetical protein
MGLAALVWNIIMFFMFSGSHAGHTHSHSLGHEGDHEFGQRYPVSHPTRYRKNVIAVSPLSRLALLEGHHRLSPRQAGIASRYDLFRRTRPSHLVVEHELRSPLAARRQRKAAKDYDIRHLTGTRVERKNFSTMAIHEGDESHKKHKEDLSALAIHAVCPALVRAS